ncbi:hypothetical protein M079_4230 [Bacteroides fragilis str. 3996 N(B) 6]|uniref:Uncharacterized protein n=3 Tax=Bacteroides fragilis TaxID=817 RepID=A0A015UZZ7_BACFG|nr:hypothetical protein HMPREF0101_04264 [Bacteroides fragilis]EXY16119.1 hypothetical protein M077_4317 [Bacteroides fragilis str. 2-F-2 \
MFSQRNSPYCDLLQISDPKIMNNFYYHVYLWKNINIFGVL